MGTIGDVREPDQRDVHLRDDPGREVLDPLADKWTALAIGAPEEGPRHFGELRHELKGVSKKMLTRTLRGLERDGLVTRTMYPAVPLRVDYAPTDGRGVAEPLSAIRWSGANIEHVERARPAYARRAAAEPVPIR